MLNDLVAYFLWRMADGKALLVDSDEYEAFVDATGGGVSLHAFRNDAGAVLVIKPLTEYSREELDLLRTPSAGEA